MKKEIKRLIETAKSQGWVVTQARNNHYIWLSPCGQHRVVSSSTPSDRRALKNIEADLRRAGLILDRKVGKK